MPELGEEIFYRAANGKDTISAQIWRNAEARPKGVIQIVHGMNEYIGRYNDFAEFLVKNGYTVCGNDHAGHGRSCGEDGFGYFADRQGDQNLVKDVRRLYEMMRAEFPDSPYIMLGHSMGSFVARSYAAQYGDGLDGVILSGTAGPNPLSGFGILFSRIIMMTRGATHPSPFLASLSFKHYNDRYAEKRTAYDWLSRNTDIVDRYAMDKQCNFIFTAGGFHDLFLLLRSVSTKKWAERIPKNLPIFIFSGSMDPVGDYTSGVKKVCNLLQSEGVENISLKFYEGGRHEMLNELGKETVYRDILRWIDNVTVQKTGAKNSPVFSY